MTRAGRGAAFAVGFYFDLYSLRREDWEAEAAFNLQLAPDVLEIMLEPPGTVARLDDGAVRDLLSLVPGVPVTAHAPTLNLSLCAASARVVDATQRELVDAVHVASRLGAPCLTFHGGDYPFSLALNGSTAVAEFIRNVRPVVDAARAAGVALCIENLKGASIFPRTPADLDPVFDAYPDMRFALDVRHFCVNGLDPREMYRRYGGRVAGIHYRDDAGVDEPELGSLLDDLLRDGWSGHFIIEDPALNVSQKGDKPMLERGLARIRRLLAASPAVA